MNQRELKATIRCEIKFYLFKTVRNLRKITIFFFSCTCHEQSFKQSKKIKRETVSNLFVLYLGYTLLFVTRIHKVKYFILMNHIVHVL